MTRAIIYLRLEAYLPGERKQNGVTKHFEADMFSISLSVNLKY